MRITQIRRMRPAPRVPAPTKVGVGLGLEEPGQHVGAAPAVHPPAVVVGGGTTMVQGGVCGRGTAQQAAAGLKGEAGRIKQEGQLRRLTGRQAGKRATAWGETDGKRHGSVTFTPSAPSARARRDGTLQPRHPTANGAGAAQRGAAWGAWN